MELQIKKLHPDAKLPTKVHPTDAGWDLYCVADDGFYMPSDKTCPRTLTLMPGQSHIFRTGIACSFPAGYVALLWGRSGMGAVHNIHRLAGVIDCSFRGEWLVCLTNLGKSYYTFYPGEKIVQALFHEVPDVTLREVSELDATIRGEKGFGSSDV